MSRHDPNEARPIACVRAFDEVIERLARLDAKMDGIGETASDAGRKVDRLARRLARQETRIRLARADIGAVRGARETWGRRIWHLLVAGGLLLAGYLLNA